MSYFQHPVAFIRHGETVWNLQKKAQGHLDSALTFLGISQANESAHHLKGVSFQLIITSSLGRSMQTANIIAETMNIEHVVSCVLLMERNLGEMQGLMKEESILRFPHCWTPEGQFLQDSDVPGGESLTEFIARVNKGLLFIKKHALEYPIIVVTHDGVLNILMSIIHNISIDEVRLKYIFKHGLPFVID